MDYTAITEVFTMQVQRAKNPARAKLANTQIPGTGNAPRKSGMCFKKINEVILLKPVLTWVKLFRATL